MFHNELELKVNTEHGGHRTRIEVVVYTAEHLRIKTRIFGDDERVANRAESTTGNLALLERITERNIIATEERTILHKVVGSIPLGELRCAFRIAVKLVRTHIINIIGSETVAEHTLHVVVLVVINSRNHLEVSRLHIIIHIVADIGAEGHTKVEVIELELHLEAKRYRCRRCVIVVLIVLVNLTALVTVHYIPIFGSIIAVRRLPADSG